MTLSKKRTINEYRQTKDSVYRHPVSHNEISDTNKTIDNLKITSTQKQRLYVYDNKESWEHSEWEPGNYDKGGKMSEPNKTYMFSKSGSKAMPIIVIEATDGSHQVDMIFDSLTEAKKFAEKHNIKMQKEGGYNMPKKLAKGDTIEIDEDNINNKHKDINMNEFMLYLRNRIDTMKRQDILPEVITSSLLVLKNNPRISLYEAIEAGCEEWNL